MKRRLFFLFVFFVLRLSAQPELLSPKPGITINGAQCLIGNTVYSCQPKTCDSVVIYAGDSIEFCTAQQVDLSSDSLYYMRWDFNGSSNYPAPVYDSFPAVTPICRYAKFDTPGTDTVQLFYNGWLSAHSYSDCYAFGPSHWLVPVTVLPSPNGVAENHDSFSCDVFPNPGNGIFRLKISQPEKVTRLIVRDVAGKVVLELPQVVASIDLSGYKAGVYLLECRTTDGVFVEKLLKQ